MQARIPAMRSFLSGEAPALDELVVRDDETIGRPRGDARFLARLECKTGRPLRREKPGPMPRAKKVVGKAGR